MAEITLKRPVTVDGVTYDKIDFDPSIDALEAFQAAIAEGKAETAAVKILLAYDDDLPLAVVGKVRMSEIMAATKALDIPFASSGPSPAGEPGPL